MTQEKTRYILARLSMILVLMIQVACSNDPDEKDISPVHIRIKNSSTVNFETVRIWDMEYGRVDAGELTDYRTFDMAYALATVSITADGSPYSLTVIDYVGEEPLRRGNYTLFLDLKEPESGGYLIQEMKMD